MNKKLKRLNKILNKANALSRERIHQLDGPVRKSTISSIRQQALQAAKSGTTILEPESELDQLKRLLGM